MEKLEIKNIKDLYKLRIRQLSGYIKGLLAIAIGMFILNLEQIVAMMEVNPKHRYISEFPQGVFVFLSIMLMIVFSFNINIFENTTRMYPQNRVTRYVASWLSDITVLGIFTLLEIVYEIVVYISVVIISKCTNNFAIITKMNLKFIIITTIYVLVYFLGVTAIIKLLATIGRKNALVLVAIVGGIIFIIRKSDLLKENLISHNVGSFALEFLIISIVYFVIGLLLEKYIKDSKFTDNYGNVFFGIIVAIVVILIAMTPILYMSTGSEEISDYVKNNKQKAEKVEYNINIPSNIKASESEVSTTDAEAIGVESIEIRKGDKAKVVVRKYKPINKNNLVEDIFTNSDIQVYVENNKFTIENKSLKTKYAALNVYGFQDSEIQNFMGNKIRNSDDDFEDFKDMLSRYTTSYRVVIYVPKENIDNDVDYNCIKIK